MKIISNDIILYHKKKYPVELIFGWANFRRATVWSGYFPIRSLSSRVTVSRATIFELMTAWAIVRWATVLLGYCLLGLCPRVTVRWATVRSAEQVLIIKR